MRLMAESVGDALVVTAAGNTSELWWSLTRETERVFYLEASMSLTSMFAAGIAMGVPHRNVVAFSGDGALCMNPGMLMVERQLSLPNLKHFIWDNGVYGSTNECDLPFVRATDYAAMARACGIARVRHFDDLENLRAGLPEILEEPGHVLTILEVEPVGHHVQSPPLDGPEVKFRFGRYLERTEGLRIFDTQLDHDGSGLTAAL